MFNISKIFITLFGIGFFPFFSGTIGSFFSIIFFYIFIDLFSILNLISIFLFVFIISIKLINIYSISIKRHDSSEIVIDEFLGIAFIMIFYDFIIFTSKEIMFLLIFILFRFFDIAKPFPANWIDKNLNGSIGVILDDIIAGGYCIIILYIINVFL